MKISNIKTAIQRKILNMEFVRTAFDSMSTVFPWYGGGSWKANISVDAAMQFTPVYAAIRLRSNTIASLPKLVYGFDNSGRRMLSKTHPVYKLLKYYPNRYQNPFSFWNTVNTWVDGWGNGYVIIVRQDGVPVELLPVHPSFVTILIVNGRKVYLVSGTKYWDGTYNDEDMMHFFNYSVDGIKGVNPIVYNSEAIRMGIGAQKFGNELYEGAGNIDAVLETDAQMTPEKVTAFLKNFRDSKAQGLPVLTHGIKWKTTNLSPEAAQMLETRTFSIQDIARIFSVPAHLLGDLSRSTFSNIEHQDIEFGKHHIRPTVEMYENEMERKLFFGDELGQMDIRFNLDSLYRGDMQARSNFYHSAINDGWMSRNEARELENLNPVEGLDDMLYPSNEVVVGKEHLFNNSKSKDTTKNEQTAGN